MSEETTNVINMTEENQPYFNALFLLAAGMRNADAEDTLVGCVQEMLRLRAIVRDVAVLDPSHESGADGFQECFFCHAQERAEHTVGCLWLRAKQAAGNA